jgi:hypothetical protein
VLPVTLLKRSLFVRAFAAAALVAVFGMRPSAGTRADDVQVNPPIEVGSQPVTGDTWSFNTFIYAGASQWASITVTNLGQCSSGPNPPRPGTAQAGAVIFYTVLQPGLSAAAFNDYIGNVTQTAGGDSGYGAARVITGTGSDDPLSYVSVMLWHLEGQVTGGLLRVCLQPAD